MTEQVQIPSALEEAKRGARLVRNAALDATDKLLVEDFPLSAEARNTVKAYRQYLRDLPASMTDDDFLTFKGVKTLAEFQAA